MSSSTQPGIHANRRSGSWVFTYGFDQFLVVDDETPTKGWGIFGNISLADQATNPVHWFLNLGAGGTSPLPGRTADSFGVGYYYLAYQQRPPGDPPARLADRQRAGLRTLLQRSDHQLVHPDGRHPGHRPSSVRRPVNVPFWSEGEDRLLAQAKVPDQSFSLPELPISLLFSTARLSSTGEKLVLYKLVRAFEHLEEQSAAPI